MGKTANLTLPLPVLLINLDRDTDRLATTLSAFEDDPRFSVTRIPGVLGSVLPTTAAERLTGDQTRRDGTLGCFLAHVTAWEFVARRTAVFTMIVEDDIAIRQKKILFSTALPHDADLVYCNKRMTRALECAGAPAAALSPVSAAAPGLGGAVRAPGLEGYLLSRNGARKLLDDLAKRRMSGHVDWHVLQASLSREAYAAAASGTDLGDITQLRRAFATTDAGWGLLNAYILGQAVVSQRRNLASTRRPADGPSGRVAGRRPAGPGQRAVPDLPELPKPPPLPKGRGATAKA